MRPEPTASPMRAQTAISAPGLLQGSWLAAIAAGIVLLTPPAAAQIPIPEPAQVNPLVPRPQVNPLQPNPLLPNPLLPNPLLPNPLAPKPATPQQGPQHDSLRPKLEEHKYQGGYSKSRSHELFKACDRNSDDRLDIIEAADAFDVLHSAKDHHGFARIDTDRDGFVTWPEFDARFKKGLENGGTFRVRTSRPFVLPDPPPQPLTPLQKFIRLYDKDGDGSLSPTELTDLLKQTGLPVDLADTLLKSDLNQSGTVEEAELAPWFQMLKLPVTATPTPDTGGLRQPWLDADANSNQAVDLFELNVLLRRIDPALLRWSKQLLAKLDTDGDGKLSAAELAALDPVEEEVPADGKQPNAKPGAGNSATKSTQAPQR